MFTFVPFCCMFITTIFRTPIHVNASVQIVCNSAHKVWRISNLHGFAIFAHSAPPIENIQSKKCPFGFYTQKGNYVNLLRYCYYYVINVTTWVGYRNSSCRGSWCCPCHQTRC